MNDADGCWKASYKDIAIGILLATNLILVFLTYRGFFFESLGGSVIPDGRHLPLLARHTSASVSLRERVKHLSPSQRKLYIDLGTLDGESIRFFMGIEGAAGASKMAQGGDRAGDNSIYGLGASGNWTVIVVEANEHHTPVLRGIGERLVRESKVQAFHLHNGTAIGKASGSVTFILDTAEGSAGATVMSDSRSAKGKRYTIPSLGISDLFQQYGIQKEDFVVLKIDVEGFEFDLLRYMLHTGLLNYVDVLPVEYHDHNKHVFATSRQREHYYSRQHECVEWVMDDIYPPIYMVHWD